jgi:mono/diheme cytochrome c family protein
MATYIEKCAPCHGESGLGDGERASQLSVPVTALGDPAVARQATLADWYRMVTLGNLERFMPPFNSLSDRQRWDVVAYAMTLSDPLAGGIGGEIDAAALYAQNCARCHGEYGQGNGPEAEGLGTMPNFTNQERMSELSAQAIYNAITNGVEPHMPAFGDSSEDERWELAGFVRSLSFDLPGSQASTTEVTPVPASTQIAEAATPEATGEAISSVSVQVTVESGDRLPEETTATLYAFDQMELVYTTTLTSHVNGLFTFENIETPAGRVFMAGVEYGGVTYGSDVFEVEDPSQPITLLVNVYETTTDTSALIVERLHIFYDFSVEGQMDVVELIIISNSSEKTIVAEEEGGPVVQIQLPEGASNIQFQDGTLGVEYLAIPGGFADTRSVQSGATDFQILVGFTLPYEDELIFEQSLSYPVQTTTILVPEMGVKVKSDQVTDSGTRDVQGVTYRVYSSMEIPGNILALEFSGKPRVGTSGSLLDSLNNPQTRNGLLFGLGAFGLVLILAGIWLYRRQNSLDEDEEGEGEEEEEDEEYENEESQDNLIDAIIALDDLYKSGELPQEAYQQRRAVLKERLSALIQNQSTNGESD